MSIDECLLAHKQLDDIYVKHRNTTDKKIKNQMSILATQILKCEHKMTINEFNDYMIKVREYRLTRPDIYE